MVVPTQVYGSARPYVRWWWFAGPIHKNDICSQLDWIKQNGFGGVEIAFMYPLKQPAYGPKWLSPELSHLVAHAVNYAGYIGLGCDLTCGTAWPFGGSIVPVQDAARLHDGLSPQRLEKSWEKPVQGYILNHLDRQALKRYMGRITAMVADATQ